MQILADENLDGPIVDWLRAEGHDVIWVAETFPGDSDESLLRRPRWPHQGPGQAAQEARVSQEFGGGDRARGLGHGLCLLTVLLSTGAAAGVPGRRVSLIVE